MLGCDADDCGRTPLREANVYVPDPNSKTARSAARWWGAAGLPLSVMADASSVGTCTVALVLGGTTTRIVKPPPSTRQSQRLSPRIELYSPLMIDGGYCGMGPEGLGETSSFAGSD